MTRLGDTTAAFASAGSRTSGSVIVMSTRTWVPSGVIASIVPTGTPSTITWLSGNSAEALVKYARDLPARTGCARTQTPAASSTTSTAGEADDLELTLHQQPPGLSGPMVGVGSSPQM